MLKLQENESALVSVGHLCRLFGVSRRAFSHRQHAAQRVRGHSLPVLELMLARRCEIRGLGTRKLQVLLPEPLAASGIKRGRDKLHQRLQTHDLLRRQKRLVPKTTNSVPSLRKEPSLPVDVELTAPCQGWVGDVTYLGIGLSFGYLSLLTDVYLTLIVVYCLPSLLTVGGSRKAAEMAGQREQPSAGSLVHHSERGSQYGSFAYSQRLRQAGRAIRIPPQGDPYANVVAERVNGMLKTEFRLNHVFTTFDEAVWSVEQRVRNYNHLRSPMNCGYLTPAAAYASTKPLQKHWKPKVYKTAQASAVTDTA